MVTTAKLKQEWMSAIRSWIHENNSIGAFLYVVAVVLLMMCLIPMTFVEVFSVAAVILSVCICLCGRVFVLLDK